LLKKDSPKIPFFSLKRQWEKISPDLTPKLLSLYESALFIGGPYIERFESDFAKYVGTPYAIACNSGTDALWLSLKAINLEPKSIVLTTPFSFIASSSEIVSHNAYPVFIDVDESYNISPKKIETWLKLNAKKINNSSFHSKTGAKISAILTVDLFGQLANYEEITAIAKEWNLKIIEDACQAVGASHNGKKAGTFGDIACFSFYPTKNLGAFGDGGVLTTSDPVLAETLLMLRNHGRKSHYNYECKGINSRLDAIQALVVTEKLKLLDSFNERRREIAKIYNSKLKDVPFINLPQEKFGRHVYHQYSITLNNRDILIQHLLNKGIGTNIYYPETLNEISFLRPQPEFQTDTPIAQKFPKTILSLPIWPELTNSEIEYICDCIKSAPLSVTNAKPHKEAIVL
jgi:dTDP-4-amino-4,6-dideoxygalactose transaminase